ncbi:MAG: YbaK/EbsC family protein [Clostridia bacterium]|nr:YbaK/EbsC family protein [Clostridia bacterium]
MSVEIVRKYLSAYGLAERVRDFQVSSATVELAAAALGTECARIAKSITLYNKDGTCLMIIAAGDVKIDNAKFKAKFAFKARMMSHEDALSATGHAVGGICPFALPDGVSVYLDESLRRFETVFPAAGSASSAVEMTCDELERASRSIAWTDVCKLREA